MNIVSLNYEDLAGLSYNLCTAINELTDHHAVSVVMKSNWIQYPQMASKKQLPELLRNADVLHLNERPSLVRPGDCEGKKIIYQFHGSRFRKYPQKTLEVIRSRFSDVTYIVATPNLLPLVPNSTWFPSVIPIEHYRGEYPTQRNDAPVLYASHTNPTKHRRPLVRATDALRKEGLEFETQWVHGVPHATNLRQKAQADIYLNGLKPFYGTDVLEASVFEMPSITGMEKFSREYMLKHEIDYPYMLVNDISEIIDAIRRLILDRSFREEEGKRAYEYVKEMHSPEIGVKRFLEMIE